MQEIPKRSMVIDAWGFIRGTPSYFPVSVNERPEDCNEEMNRTGDDVISCMKCFCCILHLYRKLESSGWMFMQNGKCNLVPHDTEIKYRYEILF